MKLTLTQSVVALTFVMWLGSGLVLGQTISDVQYKPFIRGDCNGNNEVNAADAVWILRHIFDGDVAVTCRDACDIDDSGGPISINDGIMILSFLFSTGPQPEQPFPLADIDPTPNDGIGCNGDADAVFVTAQPPGLYIVPGAGFSGPTPTPQPIGSGSESQVDTMARWDVVPWQTFGTDFNVGVVAFHKNGIQKVSFSVNGGAWRDITTMAMNPRTGVAEYWGILRATDFPTGPIEVRAIAYPNVGTPRLLEPLPLFADATGSAEVISRYVSPNGSDSSGTGSSSNPYKTARKAALSIQAASTSGTADGGIVYLMAGDHHLENGGSPVVTEDRWVTLRPAPGLTKSDVSITNSGDALETKLMRIVDITAEAAIKSGFQANDFDDGTTEAYIWVDDVFFEGNGAETSISTGGFVMHNRVIHYYATDCEVHDDKHGLIYCSFLRNVHCENIGSDVFKNVRFLMNCTVDGVDSGNTGWHADVIQYSRPQQNNIIYGLHAVNCRAQGIFSKPASLNVDNTAMVNVVIEEIANFKSEWEADSDHVLVWNCSFVDHAFYFTGTNSTNVSIRHCYFEKYGGVNGSWVIDNNHYRDPFSTMPGTNVTSGGSTTSNFLSPGTDNFAPAPNGDINGSNRPSAISNPLTPFDLRGLPWKNPASVGGIELY